MARSCKVCGKRAYSDYCMQHKPRKPIQRSSLKTSSQPIRRIGPVTKKWLATRRAWIEKNGAEGHLCHYCGYLLSMLQDLIDSDMARPLTLDHITARTRDSSLRFEFDNLTPACPPCNRKKGSLSHEQYKHICHTPLPVLS
ncbi:MAG: HNH endonuclease [Patescibacteria group bacterium]|nr:HNH endonuclease [Patescibacteria group bacterium]